MSRLFRALGDETRLRIVALLTLASIVKSFNAEQTLKKDVEKLLKTKGPMSCR